MQILLTGAAGFIGFHVTRTLLARGDSVVGIDNLNPYYDPQLKRDRLAALPASNPFRFLEVDFAAADGERLGAGVLESVPNYVNFPHDNRLYQGNQWNEPEQNAALAARYRRWRELMKQATGI